ncbi:16520_t:CDS:2 [Cetraspora pellucida]|uniref:16520_t:CDS:1 n=1 Tax=Cetraspora pellucida TaxID=1433469 RepID=A0A9N9G3K6_9GLOM|nr:16520_t:CDS:2 [Cetraspora pellucida]
MGRKDCNSFIYNYRASVRSSTVSLLIADYCELSILTLCREYEICHLTASLFFKEDNVKDQFY